MANFDIDYEKGIDLYTSAVDAAEAEIIHMGLHLPTRPEDRNGGWAPMPIMPDDLSEIKYAELTRLHGQFTTWWGYTQGRRVVAEFVHRVAGEKLNLAGARIRKTKDGTVADKDDATKIDSRYVHENAHYLTCEGVARLIVAVVDGLKKDIDAVSRAISALDSRTNVEGHSAALSRRRDPAIQEEPFRSGRRAGGSALNAFKKRKDA